MSKIIVCYKWVVDEEDIKFSSDNSSLNLTKAKNKISDYDKNSIEAAYEIAVTTGDTIAALTFGTGEVKKSVKDVLIRGADEAFVVCDDLAVVADAFITSEVLAAAIRTIGDYSLIICAEGATDTYARQVGPRIGAILNLPVISCVSEIKLEENRLVARRKLEKVHEVVSVEGPAVICVLPEINKPPIPSLKASMAASKKPVHELKVAELGLDIDTLIPRTRVKSHKPYIMERKNIIFCKGEAIERVSLLVDILRKEGAI